MLGVPVPVAVNSSSRHRLGITRYGGKRYRTMRDMIINTMADRSHRPPGMLRLLERIDKWGRSGTWSWTRPVADIHGP